MFAFLDVAVATGYAIADVDVANTPICVVISTAIDIDRHRRERIELRNEDDGKERNHKSEEDVHDHKSDVARYELTKADKVDPRLPCRIEKRQRPV